MNITTATPAEIDTLLADIYGRENDALATVSRTVATLHHVAGHKRYYGRGQQWSGTAAEALAKVTEIAESDETYKGSDAKRALAAYEAATAAVEALRAEAAPLNAEFDRRGGWTRAFLAKASNGHVHNGMDCSTCNNGNEPTQFAWFPEYSGKPEAEIVADAGERACTTCYPTAPVEDLARPTKMFSDDERAAAKAREERAAAKVARDAAKVAKALTADGSEFVLSYVWMRRSDGAEHVRREHFKTAQAAIQWIVREWAWGNRDNADMQEAYTTVIEALAAKQGKTVAEVTADIEAKTAAKIKRDNR